MQIRLICLCHRLRDKIVVSVTLAVKKKKASNIYSFNFWIGSISPQECLLADEFSKMRIYSGGREIQQSNFRKSEKTFEAKVSIIT